MAGSEKKKSGMGFWWRTNISDKQKTFGGWAKKSLREGGGWNKKGGSVEGAQTCVCVCGWGGGVNELMEAEGLDIRRKKLRF